VFDIRHYERSVYVPLSMALPGPGMLQGRMHSLEAFTIFGLSAGWAILVAALLVLYVWFCVYWWRGGRPVAGRPPQDADEGSESPRRRVA